MEIMEWFIRLNRSILDCDLEKGGWRLDEEGVAAIEDEVAELVRIIAQSHRGDIPRESAAFAEFRRTCLAVMVRLKETLPDEYDLLEQTERAEIRFFWMLRRHRLTVIFLAKLETHFPIAVHCLHTPLLYVRRSLMGLRERMPSRIPPRRYDRSAAPEWTQRAAADFLGITPRALRHYKTHPPDCHWPGWEDPIRLAQWKNQREDADRLARALRSAVPYREGPTEMDVARGCD